MSFILSFGMIHTLSAHHHLDAGEFLSTIFACVFGFLAAFVEFMASFVAPVGVAGTSARGQLADRCEFVSAVFAILVFLIFHCLAITESKWYKGSSRER